MSKEVKVNMERVRSELSKAQSKADKRGMKWWKPKDGENIIRILPPWSADGMFAKEAGYHYGVSQDASYACPKVCKGLPCPICETVTDLFKSKRSEDMALAKRISVKTRYFYNILDRVAKDKVVYVFGSGSMVYEKVLGIFADKDYGDVTDVANGYDLKVIRSGEGLDTSYEVRPVKNSSPVLNWETKKKTMVDLDAIVEADLLPYKKLKAILEGTSETEDEASEEKEEETEEVEETEEEVKPKTVAKKTVAKKPEPEEVEETEEESEDEPKDEKEEEAEETEEESEEKEEKAEKEEEEPEDVQKALAHLKTLRKKK
jgi:hypothetical protein